MVEIRETSKNVKKKKQRGKMRCYYRNTTFLPFAFFFTF